MAASKWKDEPRTIVNLPPMHALYLTTNPVDEDGDTLTNVDDLSVDSDATEPFSDMETQPESRYPSAKNPDLSHFMKKRGLLIASENDGLATHGMLAAHAQDLWLSIDRPETEPQRNIGFVAFKLVEYLKHLGREAKEVGECYEKKNFEDVDVQSAMANIGYNLMAFGLWAALLGPYDKTRVLEDLIRVAKGARAMPRPAMSNWILALSLGLECENLNEHSAWMFLKNAAPRGEQPNESSMDM